MQKVVIFVLSSKMGIKQVLQKELSPVALEWPGLLIWIMANTDLVKKKPVALEVATYKRLSDLAAQLRIDNPGGGFVSMSTAVEKLLDIYEMVVEIKAIQKMDRDYEDSLKVDIREPVSLSAYIADAEANDPNLKPEKEIE